MTVRKKDIKKKTHSNRLLFTVCLVKDTHHPLYEIVEIDSHCSVRALSFNIVILDSFIVDCQEDKMTKLSWWSHSEVGLSSFSFTIQSPTLAMLSTLLSLSMSSVSSSLHLIHSSSTLFPSPPCFLLLPFPPYTSLKYEFIDEFHDESWHLGAETRLMRGNYQDAELANGLLPSFVSSWACCALPSAGRERTVRVSHEWTFECVSQVGMSRVSSRSQATCRSTSEHSLRTPITFTAQSESHLKLGRAKTKSGAKALHH